MSSEKEKPAPPAPPPPIPERHVEKIDEGHRLQRPEPWPEPPPAQPDKIKQKD